jgi:hypothetical protein
VDAKKAAPAAQHRSQLFSPGCSFSCLRKKPAGVRTCRIPVFLYIDPLLLWVNLLAGLCHAFLLALVPWSLTLVLCRFSGWYAPWAPWNQFFTWLGAAQQGRGRARRPALEIPAADRAAGRLAFASQCWVSTLLTADAQRPGDRAPG